MSFLSVEILPKNIKRFRDEICCFFTFIVQFNKGLKDNDIKTVRRCLILTEGGQPRVTLLSRSAWA